MKRVICGALAVCLLFSYAIAGTWACGICGFENEANNLFCGTCGAERSGWVCEVCSVLDDEDAVYCKGCGWPRVKDAIWQCAECSTLNDKRFCGECGFGKDHVPAGNRPVLTGNEIAGDVVEFGFYGGNSIKWRVLENDGQALYLLSEYGVESMPYNERAGETTWAASSLRAWLHNNFFFSAFNDAERRSISAFTETNDYVSLLSLDDIVFYYNVNAYEYGFSEALICLPTQNALNNGAWAMSEEYVEGWQVSYEYPLQSGACWWWLRSSGDTADRAASVGACGDVSRAGGEVFVKDGCIRPFIKVTY